MAEDLFQARARPNTPDPAELRLLASNSQNRVVGMDQAQADDEAPNVRRDVFNGLLALPARCDGHQHGR